MPKAQTYSATLKGFKTPEQAEEFISWYEGGGEQAFYEHLQCVGEFSPDDGCNVDVRKKYVRKDGNITAFVR